MVIFSFFSDIRTIFLRVILFLCLVISLSVVKKFTTAKALIIMVVAFVIFQALANMQFYLDLFADELHIKQFNADDTRTFLYTELFDDLNTKQLFFGKGFLGTYFSEYFLLLQKTGETNGDSYIRFTVEVGFLQLILKGGFVFFLLYTLPMIYAAILGIFKGYNNRLIFMLSVFILNEFFLMFFENIPSYTINFFILFFLSGYIIKFVKNMEVKPKQNYTKSVFFDKDKKQLLTNNLDSILSQTP